MDDQFEMQAFGGTTLLGVMGRSFPFEIGNCFSAVTMKENRSIRIVNVYYENLKELIRRGTISFPIKCRKLTDRVGIIIDDRVPKEFFNDHYCRGCCPENLWN
jgi:hypothetical protein